MSEVAFFEKFIGLNGEEPANLYGLLLSFSEKGQNFFFETKQLYADFKNSKETLCDFVDNYMKTNQILSKWDRQLEPSLPSSNQIYLRCKRQAELFAYNTQGILKKLEEHNVSPLDFMDEHDTNFYESYLQTHKKITAPLDENSLKNYAVKCFRDAGKKIKLKYCEDKIDDWDPELKIREVKYFVPKDSFG